MGVESRMAVCRFYSRRFLIMGKCMNNSISTETELIDNIDVLRKLSNTDILNTTMPIVFGTY